jgi:hypothetical protein
VFPHYCVESEVLAIGAESRAEQADLIRRIAAIPT